MVLAKRIITSTVTLAAATVFSATHDALSWSGAASSVWDKSSLNWMTSSGAATAFADGNNATIAVGSGEQKTITLGEAVQPYRTVFDVDGNLTFSGGGFTIGKGANAWTKNGSGKLTVTNTREAGFIMSFGGNGFTINGGEVEFNKKKALAAVAFGTNPITVNSGATLTFAAANMLDTLSDQVRTMPIVVNGGTFKLTDTVSTHYQLGPLSLNNGTFDYSTLPGQNNELGLFTLTGKFSVSGNTPYVLSTTDDNQKKFFGVWHNPYTEFEVSDITGNDDPDLTIDLRIHNSCTTTGSAGRQVGGFVKTGDGTMLLNVYTNSFTGNIEVRGGTLQAGVAASTQMKNTYTGKLSHFGDLSVAGRTCTVYTNATLYLPNRQNFGQPVVANDPGTDFTFVLDGGVLKFQEGCENVIPNLVVRNGGSIAKCSGRSYEGQLMVAGTFKVDGTEPFVWAAAEEEDSSTLSYSLALNASPTTVFDIADVTGDGRVDADFGRNFIVNLSAWKESPKPLVGFVKRGAGTMRLSQAGCGRSFNGDALVEEGALMVDGDATKAHAIVVSADAAVGGTGSVSAVQLSEGAAWVARADQTEALEIQSDLAVPTRGEVRIVGDLGNVTKVPLFTVRGSLSDAQNLAGWPVKVNGEVKGAWKVVAKGKEVFATNPKGLILLFR